MGKWFIINLNLKVNIIDVYIWKKIDFGENKVVIKLL